MSAPPYGYFTTTNDSRAVVHCRAPLGADIQVVLAVCLVGVAVQSLRGTTLKGTVVRGVDCRFFRAAEGFVIQILYGDATGVGNNLRAAQVVQEVVVKGAVDKTRKFHIYQTEPISQLVGEYYYLRCLCLMHI